MNYKIIASSSSGNCVVIENIMIDCGISFSKIDENCNLKEIDILLLTHKHGDHLKINTLKSILKANRKINVICNAEVSKILEEHNIKHTFLTLQSEYIQRTTKGLKIKISPVKLYHDAETYGYRIFINDFFDETKILYATDTYTLEGIEAKDYDYYFLEANYCEQGICSFDVARVKGTHLSRQQCHNFYIKNKKEDSTLLELHRSSRNY